MSRSLSLLVGLLLASSAGLAESLQVIDAWSRAMPPGITTGAVYLGICNPGEEPVAIIRASTPVAERAELHQHVQRDGLLVMQAMDGVQLAAGECRQFRPGRDHLMLFGLRETLQPGQQHPLTLELTDGSLLHGHFTVIGPGNRPPVSRLMPAD